MPSLRGKESCAGLREDVVDEVDAFRCGQERAVLGMFVEVPDERVEAGEGDADRPAAQAPWTVIRVGVSEESNVVARRAEIVDLDVLVPPDGGVVTASIGGGLQMLMDRQMRSRVKVNAIWG